MKIKSITPTILLGVLSALIYVGLFTQLNIITEMAFWLTMGIVWVKILAVAGLMNAHYRKQVQTGLDEVGSKFRLNGFNACIKFVMSSAMMAAGFYVTGGLFAFTTLVTWMMITKTVSDQAKESQVV